MPRRPAPPQHFWRDPALPFAESRRAQQSRACYRPHSHPALSIGTVDAGSSILLLPGQPAHPLAAGDVVVIPAHWVHSCNPAPGCAWSYQMLYLDEAWLIQLFAEADQPAGPQQLVPARALWQNDPLLYRAFCELNTLLFSPAPAELKEAQLIDFAGLVIRGLLPATQQQPDWVSLLQQQLRAHPAEPWPLAELAGLAGVSRYHLVRTFKSRTGLTPHAYLLDCRINAARQRLPDCSSLAQLASELGFADQSHFVHAFKQRVSVTPGEYQRLQSCAISCNTL
ncbi:helix-turn-helix transcriptional regulator [Chitinilyticum piscinae]|uniref:Helix-turn-helix transcriptional regulator n=1 Tax=Chitinilyticum piscinae TaxID=2866724 RepID=A0A8J7FP60_9NEIS|nr:AraC family transcriptional regulator [Chitinilyticum piscinae]MBE9610471.1 helix-turn-helix transcriptional regulator [Chitinilyticum piscinae]